MRNRRLRAVGATDALATTSGGAGDHPAPRPPSAARTNDAKADDAKAAGHVGYGGVKPTEAARISVGLGKLRSDLAEVSTASSASFSSYALRFATAAPGTLARPRDSPGLWDGVNYLLCMVRLLLLQRIPLTATRTPHPARSAARTLRRASCTYSQPLVPLRNATCVACAALRRVACAAADGVRPFRAALVQRRKRVCAQPSGTAAPDEG